MSGRQAGRKIDRRTGRHARIQASRQVGKQIEGKTGNVAEREMDRKSVKARYEVGRHGM